MKALAVAPLDGDVLPAAPRADAFTLLRPGHASTAATYLLTAFIWSETKEGALYWTAVYDRLCHLATLPERKRLAAGSNAPAIA